jgi:tetratricopeptide (TPR) repeat protein
MVKENPNSAEGYLRLAMAEGSGKQEIPPKANKSAEKAISLGLTNPASIATAYQTVGRYSLGVNKLDDAIAQLSQAVEATKSLEDKNQSVFSLYHRSLAYRHKEQYEAAYQDLQQAMQLVRDARLPEAISFLEKEMTAVSKHAGRPLDQFNLPPS